MRLAVQKRRADQCGGEDPADHRDDRFLCLAVGVGPWRRVGDPDDAVAGADTHQHMLGVADLSAGELQRFAKRDGVRNRFNVFDFQRLLLCLVVSTALGGGAH